MARPWRTKSHLQPARRASELGSWAGHYRTCSFRHLHLLCSLFSEVLSGWQSTLQWPFCYKACLQHQHQALFGFSPLKFLPVQNGEAQVACYFEINRVECSCWFTELATSESSWNPWLGDAKLDKGGSHQSLDIFKTLVRKNACFNGYAECNSWLI